MKGLPLRDKRGRYRIAFVIPHDKWLYIPLGLLVLMVAVGIVAYFF
jgi:hypothetical protein